MTSGRLQCCNSPMTTLKSPELRGPMWLSECSHSSPPLWQNKLPPRLQSPPGGRGTNSGQEDAAYAGGATYSGSSSSCRWFLSPACRTRSSSHCMAQGKAPPLRGDCCGSCRDHSAHTPGRSKRRLRLLMSKSDTARRASLLLGAFYLPPLGLHRLAVLWKCKKPSNDYYHKNKNLTVEV